MRKRWTAEDIASGEETRLKCVAALSARGLPVPDSMRHPAVEPGTPTVCYSLTASDEPLQVRYVGETSLTLSRRLNGHMCQQDASRKRVWIQEVVARGARVVITELSRHECTIAALRAEDAWIQFWSQYCDLFNLGRHRSDSLGV